MIFLLIVSIIFLVGCSDSDSAIAMDEGYKKDSPLVVKFSHISADSSPKGQAAIKFKKLLEQKTDGRVEVQVFPSSQLYGDKDELEALQDGNVQLIALSTAKLVGLNPSFQVTSLYGHSPHMISILAMCVYLLMERQKK